MIVAKRLRVRIAAMSIKVFERDIRITPSFGVAGFTASQLKPGFSTEIFLDKVDKCLCQAMEDGGDTIKGVQIG
jgi:two-component system, cell cycle response regulator